MGDSIKMLFVVFLFVPFFLWAEEVQLNLPERFDAKIKKGYRYTANGTYPINFDKDFWAKYDTPPKSIRIIHFDNGKFHMFCKYTNYHQFDDGSYTKTYNTLEWKGKYTKDGIINGYFSYYRDIWRYNDKEFIPNTFNDFKDYEKGTLYGVIKGGGKIFIRQQYTQVKYYNRHTKYINDRLFKVTKKWDLRHYSIEPIKATYDLEILSEINTQVPTQKGEPIPDNEFELPAIPTDEISNKDTPITPQSQPSPPQDTTTLYTTTQEQPLQPQPPKDPCT
ncbi:hypothetical protein, partial [Sulfurovum sp.]|uniref:hypothetical protein n=1 Tax=Sulfurovum sp. TaxID=1969726 RepID=UPI0025F76982